jgi:uncharacterized protein (UPF0335 family)
MKHIRKFNENNISQELDFETFKMIISSDIEDEFEFDNIDYYDVQELDDQFYDCRIQLNIPDLNVYPDEVDFGFSYLSNISDFDSPEDFNIELILTSINHEISKIEQLRRSIERVERSNKELIDIMKTIEKVVKRLENFSNCKSVTIGFDIETIRLCFDIKDDYYIENF